jgi:hypothetical protein
MGGILHRRIERRHRRRRTASSRAAHEAATRVPDENDIRGTPRPTDADPAWYIADSSWQPPGAVHPFDLAQTEERERSTVRRPGDWRQEIDVLAFCFRTLHRGRFQRVEAPDPQMENSLCVCSTEHKMTSIR